MRDHFAVDSSLQGGLRVDPLTVPEQALRARRPHDLFPEDVQPVSARDAERGMREVAIARALRRDVDVRDKISPRLGPSILSMNESPVPVITSALFSRSSEISSTAAGKASWTGL
jgi:hypothetical protein